MTLYRPFPADDFVAALPTAVKNISVLDRTKEAGASGEPLYQDVMITLMEAVSGGTIGGDAVDRRRPLRPFVEGIHTGDGQGGL